MPRYTLWLLVLGLSLLGIQWGLFNFVLELPMLPVYFVLYAYLLLLGFGPHALLARAIKKRPQSFINTFMATMSIKMLVSLGVLMAAIYLHRDHLMPVAISFLVGYFSFMMLEVMNMRAMSMAQTQREKAAREAAEGND